jgi:uncharacterized membrane protein YfcA
MLSISNIDSVILIQVVLIFLAGGMVKGLIGVGLPTVTLTLLSFVFDIKDSISIILIPVILTNLYQMLDGNYLKEIIGEVKFFLIGSFLFIFPGFYFLTILKSDTILAILALLLIINSFMSLMKYEIKLKNYKSKAIQLGIGSLTGITTGVTSIYTMPFIFLIQSLNYSKNKVIQLMGLSFFIFACMQLILFSSHGMIDFDKLSISLLACLPILAGVYFGTALRKKISETLFKTLFNIMLVAMGSLLILKIIF